ncbi:MAG: TetR/AcrR family transcriptional regulator [Desulfobacteraceae bacterium]|nr:TetR/AcrR family transcriptional regulator [Desulfobacteraceae bacterium]
MQSQQDSLTRKRLFNAGIKVFAKKGFRDATVREICKQADSANINSVNYYFGSKEKLYREILELIFSEYDKFDLQEWKKKTPELQLKEMIQNFCSMLYKKNVSASDITTIFVYEMTRPSPFIEDFVYQYNRPRVERHLQIFNDLLGDGATEDMVRDCLVSVSGQLLYYSFAWPVFSRLFPKYSLDEKYEAWADHVFEFSMGGINSIKEKLKKHKEDSHGD